MLHGINRVWGLYVREYVLYVSVKLSKRWRTLGMIQVLRNGEGGGGGDVRFRLFQHYEYVGSKPISVMRGAGVKLPEKMLEIWMAPYYIFININKY